VDKGKNQKVTPSQTSIAKKERESNRETKESKKK